jgi:hypothetical protein
MHETIHENILFDKALLHTSCVGEVFRTLRELYNSVNLSAYSWGFLQLSFE